MVQTQTGIDGEDAQALSAPASSSAWRQALIALTLALAGLVAVFWQTVSQMVETWYVSATFNHGFMIVPICGWLLWERREAIEKYVPKPDFRGLVLIAAAALVWTVADAAGVQSVMQFAFVGMVQGVVFTVLGWRLVRAMLFPLGFLLFAVPFGDFLIPTLQDVTAVMVVEGLRWIDIPVYIDGVFLSIPTGNFEVAEACSGVRFLIATIALGCLFANLSFRSPGRRTVIMILSVLVPIIANGIRAFGIVYIAHVTDHKVAVGVDHLVYGWIFFAFVTVVLLAIGMTFRETDGDNEIYMPEAADRTAGRYSNPRGLAAATVASLAVAAAAPAYASVIIEREVTQMASPLTAPGMSGGWQALPRVSTDWRPRFAGADAELMKTFRKSGADVHLYMAYYTHQRQGAELVNSANTFIDGVKWSRASSGFTVAQVDGRNLDVKVTRLLGRGKSRVVWEWYWIGGRFTSDRYIAKIYEALAKLGGSTQAAAAVIVAADYDDSPADAERTLQDFLSGQDDLTRALERAAR